VEFPGGRNAWPQDRLAGEGDRRTIHKKPFTIYKCTCSNSNCQDSPHTSNHDDSGKKCPFCYFGKLSCIKEVHNIP